MSAQLRGFWQCVWVYKREILTGWDFWVGLILAGILAFLVPDSQPGRIIATLARVQLGVATALFGVVLAGLAVIVAFLHEDYLELLLTAGEGLEADFFPFWFTASLAVISIVLDLLVIVVDEATLSHIPAELVVFAVSWMFLWTLFAALNLVPFTAAHGINRALQIQLDEDDGA